MLIAFILLNRRDTVWYENPGHIAGRDVMQLMGAKVAPIPIDNEGIDLNFAANKHPKPTLIFTTPSHQHPLGTTMSLARRLALLKYANENDRGSLKMITTASSGTEGGPFPRSVLWIRNAEFSMLARFPNPCFLQSGLVTLSSHHGLLTHFQKLGTYWDKAHRQSQNKLCLALLMTVDWPSI